jgi:hypothetical protein
VYRAGQTDLGGMVLSLVIMSRSHNESFEKANRLRASWSRKRETITERKMTAMCPSWLKLHRDKKHFEVIENRADLIRRIFDDAAGGMGLFTITRRLNEEKQPSFTTSRGWHQSYVARILKNRAVLGEFQPHKSEGEGKVPAGEVHPNYYPQIIDEDLFLRVQRGLAQRRDNGAGRKGAQVTNLFGGLLICDHCGSKMVFENKGNKPKGAHYIVCEAGRRLHRCRPARWRYDQFEATFLTVVEEIDLGSMFSVSGNDVHRKQIQDQVEAHNGKLVELDREFANAYELVKMPGFSSTLVGERIVRCEREIAKTKAQIDKLSAVLENQRALAASFYDGKIELKHLIAKIKDSPDVDAYKIRAQISARLKSIVAEIRVAPMGNLPAKERQIEFARKIRGESPDHPVLEAFAADPTYAVVTAQDKLRFFRVYFKTAAQRTVYPKHGDPTHRSVRWVIQETQRISSTKTTRKTRSMRAVRMGNNESQTGHFER